MYNTQDLKILEAYLSIGSSRQKHQIIDMRRDLDERDFKESLKQTIIPSHQVALNQGFEIWHNSN
jgi:hypothetical protein